MARIQSVHVIINPAAGQNEPILNTLNRVFHRHNIRWDVSITHQAGDGRIRAKEAAKKEVDLIIAYGGDGSVMDIANGLVGQTIPLAVLAGGTANAVALELGVPFITEKALEQICQGKGDFRAIDMGCTGQRDCENIRFLLRADTGLSTDIMRSTTREMKERYGALAYLLTYGRTIYQPPLQTHYRLIIDGQHYEDRGAACVITNMSSVGTMGLNLSRHVKFDDGLLDVFVLKNDVLSIMQSAASILKLTSLDNIFHHWQGKEITIETQSPQPVNCDAEPCGETPLTVQVVPGAVKVFVPQN